MHSTVGCTPPFDVHAASVASLSNSTELNTDPAASGASPMGAPAVLSQHVAGRGWRGAALCGPTGPGLPALGVGPAGICGAGRRSV